MAKSRQARLQTGLRLDGEMIERLRQSGRGLSDEIRERLERTFKEDALDPVTRELRVAVANIAAALRRDYDVEWNATPTAHRAFVVALSERLARYAPPTPIPTERNAAGLTGSATDDLFENPETIGRIRERDDREHHDYPRLNAALNARARRWTARAPSVGKRGKE